MKGNDMKRILFGAAIAALCSLAACQDGPRSQEPVNLVQCEGAACNYDDGTQR